MRFDVFILLFLASYLSACSADVPQGRGLPTGTGEGGASRSFASFSKASGKESVDPDSSTKSNSEDEGEVKEEGEDDATSPSAKYGSMPSAGGGFGSGTDEGGGAGEGLYGSNRSDDLSEGDKVHDPVVGRSFAYGECQTRFCQPQGKLERYDWCGDDHNHLEEDEKKAVLAIRSVYTVKACQAGGPNKDEASYQELKELTRLVLKDKGIATLYPLMGFEGLIELQLSKNQISTDLRGLANLSKLKILSLDHNKLTSLSGLCNAGSTQLEILNLSNNQIKSVLPLKACTKLRGLDISNNQIGSIVPILDLGILSLNYAGNEGVLTEVGSKEIFETAECSNSDMDLDVVNSTTLKCRFFSDKSWGDATGSLGAEMGDFFDGRDSSDSEPCSLVEWDENGPKCGTNK